MKQYTTRLKLRYDPFEPGKVSRDFFPGGERQHLLGKLIEISLSGSSIAAVTGPLGSGKTTLAREFHQYFNGEATCLLIAATLFMNQAQFLDAVGKQLPKHKHISGGPNIEASLQRINQLAQELDLEAQSLILIVDDAHELSAEVLELISKILRKNSKSNVHALLLGEQQLVNLLENTWPNDGKDNLRLFKIANFSSEDTLEYIRFKLSNAGYTASLPLSGGVIGRIHNSCNGIPGTINALVSESLDGDQGVANQHVTDDDSHFISPLVDMDLTARDAVQIDLDMDQPDSHRIDDDDYGPVINTQGIREVGLNWANAYLTNNYWLAATVLAGIMLVTVFTWDSGIDSSSAIAGGNGSRIELPVTTQVAGQTDVAGALSAISNSELEVETASAEVVDQSPESRPASAQLAVIDDAGASSESQLAALPRPATNRSSNLVQAATPTPTSAPKPAVATPKPAPAAPKLPAFEQELLQYPATNYTIQLLGSYSEASAKNFVAARHVQEKYGYFETRHQNKPWFVVILGSYRERSAALEVIDRLPESLRSMQPWVRPLAPIQRDIRQLRKIN